MKLVNSGQKLIINDEISVIISRTYFKHSMNKTEFQDDIIIYSLTLFYNHKPFYVKFPTDTYQ